MLKQIHFVQSVLFSLFLTLFVFISSSATASETEWVYRWEGDPTNLIIDNDAGVFEYLEARYDTGTSDFTFLVRMAPPAAHPERLARGFTLIVSSGPYPHHEGAEFAVFYFDATDLNNPKIVAYPYNAYDDSYDSFSYQDARFFQAGTQIPDKLCTSLDATSCLGWVDSVSSSDDVSGKRTFSFKVNTSIINNYSLTWPNPAAQAWEGAQFQSTFGIWLVPQGHPDLAFSYGIDGFIESVNFGAEFLGQEFLGFFDGNMLPTSRDPYCASAPMSYSLSIGEAFSTSVTGTSPDNNVLEVNYSGAPAGSSFDPVAGSQQAGSITSDFSWTPTAADAGKSYEVDVVFTEVSSQISVTCPFTVMVQSDTDCLGQPGGTAVYDICGVCDGDGTSCLDCLSVPFGEAELDRCGVCEGNGLSCLGCSDVDITESLLELDGNGEKQAFVVGKLLKKFVRLEKGTTKEASARSYREAQQALANDLRFQNWNITWSVPEISTECVNSEFCVTVDRSPTFDQYLANSKQLFKLAKKAARKVKKSGGNPSRLLARARKLRNENVVLVEETPLTSDVCS